jgi:prenyltransferase beta subunit
MPGAQGGKLVKVQRCPATVTPLVKPDNPPFMTQTLRGKACWVPVIIHPGRSHPAAHMGGFGLTTFSHQRSFIFNERNKIMKIKVSPKINALLAIIILFSSITSSAAALPIGEVASDSQVNPAISQAVNYLQTQLNDDGGIRWFNESSSVPTTIRVVVALSAAGLSQDAIISDSENRPIDFLSVSGTDWIYQAGSEQPGLNIARAGQLITAVAASNQNPHAFGPNAIDLINIIKSQYQQDSGIFGASTQDNVLDQVWAILGLAAAHASIPNEAVAWLISAQNPDGSWNDGFGSFLDTTPLGVMALAAADQENLGMPALQNAVEFMLTNQQTDGGWQTEWDSATNANTTGMMIQGLVAASTIEPELYASDIADARLALLEIQQQDGVFGVDFANAYSTADAILGLTDQTIFNLGSLRRVSYAFEFIFSAQASDGGWGSVGQTIDVILALTAAGWDPATVMQNGTSSIDYLAENLPGYLDAGPDAIGKSILGLVAARQDPDNFNNLDLITILMETYDPDLSAFGDPDNTWHQSLALLGLSAANQSIPEGAELTLIQQQQEDGGWEYSPGFGTSADNTSLALQALLAAGRQIDDEVIQNSLRFLEAQQTPDGGWGDSSTTAFAIMALNSLDLPTSDWITENQQSPMENIFTYQGSSGGFFYSSEFPQPNLMSTTSAVLAVLSGSYIISPEMIDAENYAGLIVHPGDTDIKAVCVSFSTPSISGFELLDSTEIPFVIQDGFINSIMDISNPSGGTMYWSYWRWNGREWSFNNIGISDSVVYPGSIEAWYFTSWEVFPSLPPDYVPNLNQICNQTVLRDYSDQPSLNYWNLNPTPLISIDEVPQTQEPILDEPAEDLEEVREPIQDESVEEVEQIQQPTPAEISQDAGETPRSTLPLIIIGVAGTIVLLTIAALLIKKK